MDIALFERSVIGFCVLCVSQACTQRRMYNGSYPSTPFINHYDTPADFHKREHRMKRMAKGKLCLSLLL